MKRIVTDMYFKNYFFMAKNVLSSQLFGYFLTNFSVFKQINIQVGNNNTKNNKMINL